MDPAESRFPCACRGKGSFRLGPRYPAGPVEGLYVPFPCACRGKSLFIFLIDHPIFTFPSQAEGKVTSDVAVVQLFEI